MEQIVKKIELSGGVKLLMRENAPSKSENQVKAKTKVFTPVEKNRKKVDDYRIVKLDRCKWAVEVLICNKWKEATSRLFKSSTKAIDWIACRFEINV